MLSLQESKRRVALFNAVKDAENELERVQHEYLRATGWHYTSDTPGCLWLWQKECPASRRGAGNALAGRVMLLSTDTAYAMQRSWDDIERARGGRHRGASERDGGGGVKSESKLYGVIDGIVGNEGEGVGNLSVCALLSPSELAPKARIVVGSTPTSEINLGQFALSVPKALRLIAELSQACADVVAACPSSASEDGQ